MASEVQVIEDGKSGCAPTEGCIIAPGLQLVEMESWSS